MASKHVYDDELDAIRDRRRALQDVTDSELAEIAGISRRTLLRYMNGGDPPHSVVRALSERLDLHVTVETTGQETEVPEEYLSELAGAVA